MVWEAWVVLLFLLAEIGLFLLDNTRQRQIVPGRAEAVSPPAA
jgi:hypothetical protein